MVLKSTLMLLGGLLSGSLLVCETVLREELLGSSQKGIYYGVEYYRYFEVREWDYTLFLSGKLAKSDLNGLWKRRLQRDGRGAYEFLLEYVPEERLSYWRVFRDEEENIRRIEEAQGFALYIFVYDGQSHLREIQVYSKGVLQGRRMIYREGKGGNKLHFVEWLNHRDLLRYVDHYYLVKGSILMVRVFPNEQIQSVKWYDRRLGVLFYKEKNYNSLPIRFESSLEGVLEEEVDIEGLLLLDFDSFKESDLERILFYGEDERLIYEEVRGDLRRVLSYRGGFLKKQIDVNGRVGDVFSREELVDILSEERSPWTEYTVTENDPYNKELIKKTTFTKGKVSERVFWQRDLMVFRTEYRLLFQHVS